MAMGLSITVLHQLAQETTCRCPHVLLLLPWAHVPMRFTTALEETTQKSARDANEDSTQETFQTQDGESNAMSAMNVSTVRLHLPLSSWCE